MREAKRPLLLDLFCGAGGAAMGYYRAGFDVVGVDLKPQPRYPFTFIQADALEYPLTGVDAIHASPPCQAYSQARYVHGKRHPGLIYDTRRRLEQSGLPWILENVRGALGEMPSAVMLCGTRLGLHVYRHRLFESSHMLFAPGLCGHPRWLLDGYMAVYGSRARGRQRGNVGNLYTRYSVAEARAAMGIEWMNLAELSQAIPPAYTHWLGSQLIQVVR